MIFKQAPTLISDLNKLGIALKSLDGMKIGTVGVNVANVEAYRTVLKGLSVEQSVFALASKGATEDQIRQILITNQATASEVEAAMAKAGLTTATKALTQAEMVEMATKNGVVKAEAEALLSKIGITATEEGQVVVKKQITYAMLEQAIASGTLTKAEASQIATMLGLSAAETANIGITNVLTASFTKLWDVITAHPIGAILTAIGAVAVGTIAYINKVNKDAEKALLETHENAEKALEDTKTSLSDDKSELQSINSNLEQTKEKISEISSIGAPTLTEQNELNKLSTANVQLEIQKSLLENNIKLKQKSAALDAKELLGTQVEMEYSSILDNGSITSATESYSYGDHAKYQAANLKNAYNIYMKALEEGNIQRQELAQELIDASAGNTAELTSKLLEIVESFKYDDGTIIEGYEGIYNEYMGMIYNLQSLTNPDTFLDIAKSITVGTDIDYEKAITEAYALAYEGNFDVDNLNQDFVKALADVGIDESTIDYIFSLKQKEYQLLVDKINDKYKVSEVPDKIRKDYWDSNGTIHSEYIDVDEETKKRIEENNTINQSLNDYAKEKPIEFQLITSYDEGFILLDKYIAEEKKKAENNADYVGDYITNAINRIYDEAKVNSETFNNETDILSISDTIDNLNTQLKPTFDALKSAYQNIFTEEGFTLDDVDISTFASIKSAIDELNRIDGIEVNYDAFDNFVKVLNDTSSTSEQVQEQFDELATSIIYSTDCTDISADTFDLLMKSLYAMGLTNAPEVLNNLKAAQEEITAAGYNVKTITQEQAIAFINEANASAIAKEYLKMYMIQKQLDKPLNTVADAQALENLCNDLGITGEMLQAVISLKSAMGAISAGVDYNGQYSEQAEKAKQKIQELANGNGSFRFDFSSNVTSPSSSSSSVSDSDLSSASQPSEVTQEFNWLENYLEKFAKVTERITNKISDYLSFKKNQSTIKSALKAIRNEYSANEKALQKYEEQMEAIGLSQTYIDKIKNGDLNTETITGYETDGNKDANAQLIEKIQLYQDLYDKSEEIRDKLTELGETEKEWLVKNLELIEEYYSNKASLISDQIDEKESEISLKEASGKIVKTSDYNSLVSKTKQEISALNTEYEKVTAEFNKLVRNGTIEKDSKEWFSWQKTISELTQEITSSQEELIEWQEAISQLKIDGYTSSIDRLQAKYEKLNTIISRKEASNIVATQSDYNKVISNLNQQISKNNTLLEYYKQLQAQTEKNSKKWKEYQELIEQTEATVESLKDSIIETAQKTADITAEIRDLKLEDNQNASNLLSAKYDNATTASERNKILHEQDALAKSNLEINNQAYKDYTDQANELDKEFSQYISNATKNISESNSLITNTSGTLQKESERYNSYANAYIIAQEKYSNATTKEEKATAKAEMQNLSAMMDESAEKIKALETALSSYNTDLETNQSIVSQLAGYEFGKEIDLSKITDEDLLKKAAQYNETLKQQKQALIDVGLSEQEAIKVLRENASQRIQNCLDEYEAMNKLNKAQRDNINAKISLNKTQGYTITDGEYETYIKSSQESIKIAQEALNKAQAEFDRNLADGLYENNEEKFIEDKANLESAKANLYELWEDSESMLDEILQLRIDALTEEKEALQKLYELQERRYKLEEAQYNLEKAKQRTNLVYNGDEFVYQADANTLKQAEKALEEAQHNELINKIDDWIDAMEEAKKNFNLYDVDGNALGSTEDIIKAAIKYGDDFLDGLEKIFKLNNLEYSDGEIKQIQTFADGGVVSKSNDNKFDTATETLGEDSIVPLKNEELIFTQEQGSQLQQKFAGISPVFSDSLHLKPTIPAPVDVNAASHIEINMNGDMQFNEVQNVNDLSKAIVNGQLRSSMKRELGRLKM